jgi:hypothetical protein
MLLGNGSLNMSRGNEYTCNNRRPLRRDDYCVVRVVLDTQLAAKGKSAKWAELVSVSVCVCVCTVESPQKRGVATTSHSRPLIKEEAPFKARKNMGEGGINKSMLMVPNGTRNQIVFTGEG